MNILTLKHFKPGEFRMGKEIVYDKMDSDFLLLLDKLRELVGESLQINSSYRSKLYNEAVRGSKNSLHLRGKAVDLYCNNGTLRAKIIKNALNLGLSCGVYNTWIHVDNRKFQIVYNG